MKKIILLFLILMTMLSFTACGEAERKTPKKWCIEEAEKVMFEEYPELYNKEYIGYVVNDITVADSLELDDYPFNAYSIAFYFDALIKTYLCTIYYKRDEWDEWSLFFGGPDNTFINKESILDLDLEEVI